MLLFGVFGAVTCHSFVSVFVSWTQQELKFQTRSTSPPRRLAAPFLSCRHSPRSCWYPLVVRLHYIGLEFKVLGILDLRVSQWNFEPLVEVIHLVFCLT